MGKSDVRGGPEEDAFVVRGGGERVAVGAGQWGPGECVDAGEVRAQCD